MTILIFTIANAINILVSTIKSIATIRGGKFWAAMSNGIAYGYYTLIMVYTVDSTINLYWKGIIVGILNFIVVYIVKCIEEKMQKEKLWKLELTVKIKYIDELHKKLDDLEISHHYYEVGKYSTFNVYCDTKQETKDTLKIAKKFKGNCTAMESLI